MSGPELPEDAWWVKATHRERLWHLSVRCGLSGACGKHVGPTRLAQRSLPDDDERCAKCDRAFKELGAPEVPL